MTNTLSIGLIEIGKDSRITCINQKCLEMLGLDFDKAIGGTLQSVFGDNLENQHFIDVINRGDPVSDYATVLSYGKNQIKCFITYDPLYIGTVILLRKNPVRQSNALNKPSTKSAKKSFNDILGHSSNIRNTISIAQITSHSESNVLLLGESGTGKDIFAQAIHNSSPRKDNPFLALNCAAIPRELIASELFGYDDGAFTGAKKGGNAGKFELANHGTLFLDEIGDLPTELQTYLLRVLEERTVIRLGGNKLIPVNVRIIAATNKNLEEEIANQRFRNDLYFRLGVIKIVIPPLRERKSDIPILIDHFLQVFSERFDKPLKSISSEATDYLIDYPWYGNIRELQNILEGAVQLCPQKVIDYNFIKSYLGLGSPLQTSILKMDNPPSSSLELLQLEMALKKNKYNKTKTAKELGMSRQCLYRRMQKYNLS